MKQEPGKPDGDRTRAGDEGAEYTKRLVSAVTRLRKSKDPSWSAERLAAEMTAVGVPWTRNSVVNLESGRRKQIAMHEVLALMFVLDAPRPLEVMVPGDEVFPVVPGLLVDPEKIRAWLRGEGGPLRHVLAEGAPPQGVMESAAELFEQQGRPDMAAEMRRMASLLPDVEDSA